MKLEDYKNAISHSSIETIYEDIVNQTHELAKGLSKKYSLLYCSTIFLAIQILIIVLTGLIIIK